jgi:LAGLIDADG DNA endonuclease family protein
MPTIGTVSPHALKKGNKKIRLDKKEYLSIPSSFLAFLAGLIDGDGYIQVSRTTKGFITIKLVISLHLEDISTLEYIRSVLKIGKLTIYRDLKSPCCRLVINRTDLQEVLFPLLIHHGIFFLTETRKAQFDLAMFILKNDKKVYDQLPAIEDIPGTFELPKTASDYANLTFFKN